MSILIINGSPRKNGATAKILIAISDRISEDKKVELIHINDLNIKPCIGCMKCRPDKECVLPEDGAHLMRKKINEADALVVGTSTYWGNMSGQLKILFDRNVPLFEYIGKGIPKPKQKGKKAVIVVTSAAPWPFNLLGSQSAGAVRAVKVVLRSAGYKIIGTINMPNTKKLLIHQKRFLKKQKDSVVNCEAD